MNNYIVWRVMDSYAHHLSWDYKYASFMFYEKYTGTLTTMAVLSR